MSNFGLLYIDSGHIYVFDRLGRNKFVQGDFYYRESRDILEKSRVMSLIRKHKNDL